MQKSINQYRRLLLVFSLLFSFFFLSCNFNFLNSKTSDVKFSFNKSVLPQGAYKVKCSLSGSVNEIQIKEFENYTNQEIAFNFVNIPLNQEFTITVEIYNVEITPYPPNNEVLKYKGIKTVVLTNDKSNIVKIELTEVKEQDPGASGGLQPSSDFINITTTYNFAIGDIIFSDNTVLPYEKSIYYDAEKWASVEKQNAIAVIFKASSGTNKALGIGVKQSESTMAWAENAWQNASKGYSTKIDNLICTPSNTSETTTSNTYAENVTFSGTTSGKNSWQEICNKCDDTQDSTKYISFYFVNNYGTDSLNLQNTQDFAKDWYMPTVAEIVEVYKNKTIINSIFLSLEQEELKEYFWTSSQSEFSGGTSQAWLFTMSNGNYQTYTKSDKNYICVIREF